MYNLEKQEATYGGFLDDKDWYKDVNLITATDDGLFIGKQGPWNSGSHKVEIEIVRTGKKTAKAYLTYEEVPIFGDRTIETAVLDGKRK